MQDIADYWGGMFSLEENLPLFAPRFNIAPTQDVVALAEMSGDARPIFRMFRWGLIPSWAKDHTQVPLMINARAETIRQKPSFRSAFRKRRCIIPADGFYEWKSAAGTKRKQPYHIFADDRHPLALAGIWERWRGGDRETAPCIESCTIITTIANGLMESIHDRMPVILDREQAAAWLDPAMEDTDSLQDLLRPCPSDWLRAEPVSTYVSNARNEGPECLAAPDR